MAKHFDRGRKAGRRQLLLPKGWQLAASPRLPTTEGLHKNSWAIPLVKLETTGRTQQLSECGMRYTGHWGPQRHVVQPDRGAHLMCQNEVVECSKGGGCRQLTGRSKEGYQEHWLQKLPATTLWWSQGPGKNVKQGWHNYQTSNVMSREPLGCALCCSQHRLFCEPGMRIRYGAVC